MKKVLFVLFVATLAACGGSASTEVKTDSLTQDSLTPSAVVADSAIIDSLKQAK